MKTTILIITMLVLTVALFGCATQEVKVMKSTGTQEVVEAPAKQPTMTYTEAKQTTTTATTTPEMTFEEEEAKAIEAGKAIIKNLDGYKNQNGRQLEVLNSAKLKCEGCWVMDMSFTRDLLYYPDKTEHIKVNLKLKDWKMDTYTFG